MRDFKAFYHDDGGPASSVELTIEAEDADAACARARKMDVRDEDGHQVYLMDLWEADE